MELKSLERLTAQFAKLPGIGVKTAQRLAYFVLTMPEDEVKQFAVEMYDARKKIQYCKICGNMCESEICDICADDRRDRSTICVVKDARDVAAIEKTHEYRGLYHVLGGTISPLEGVGPDDIAIAPLVDRVDDTVEEVILATNPDVQGEATASYLSKILGEKEIKITRIAHGVPIGAQLEYADEITLAKALEGRTDF